MTEAHTPAGFELALGPCFFNWAPERVTDFYAMIADEAPIDRVYLGEVVCGKRTPLSPKLWARIVGRLERAGKTVVTSLLALPISPRDRAMVQRAAQAAAHVEINDVSALGCRAGQPFTAGPFLNVYNEATLAILADRGCESWCPPVELPLDAIAAIARAVPKVVVELFAFGRLPLAVSARCHHARAHGRAKQGCQFVCGEDVDGMDVETLDGAPFLAVNGVQTLSHAVQAAALTPAHLHKTGIRRLRLSPQNVDMAAVAMTFRGLLDGAIAPDEGERRLEALALPGQLCNGYLRGAAGWRRLAT